MQAKASTGYITAAENTVLLRESRSTGRVTAFTASSLLAIELVTCHCLVTLLFHHRAKIVLVFLSLPS